MPWFYCDDCGDSIKKPKLKAHANQCSASGFTCIDCSLHFDQASAHGHTACVTEHEKYALGATKPGGYAAKGFPGGKRQQGGAGSAGGEAAVGAEYLSTRPPWKCSVCRVTCTSEATLQGHAAGTKHRRRAKAALAAASAPADASDGGVGTRASADAGSAAAGGKRKEAAAGGNANGQAEEVGGGRRKRAKQATHPPQHEGRREAGSASGGASGNGDAEEAAAGPAEGAAAGGHGIKGLVKLVKKQLKAADGSMELKQLLRQALAAAGLSAKDAETRKALRAKLKASANFQIDGTSISYRRAGKPEGEG